MSLLQKYHLVCDIWPACNFQTLLVISIVCFSMGKKTTILSFYKYTLWNHSKWTALKCYFSLGEINLTKRKRTEWTCENIHMDLCYTHTNTWSRETTKRTRKKKKSHKDIHTKLMKRNRQESNFNVRALSNSICLCTRYFFFILFFFVFDVSFEPIDMGDIDQRLPTLWSV